MSLVCHRFLDHKINPETETLIIGTFNPETEGNPAEFFYGRSRNYLWRLLPSAFQETDLKNGDKHEKLTFIERRRIDFIDLISKIEVEEGHESNFYDGYIDGRVNEWRNIIVEIDQLQNIKRVCFTRKTFSDIPNMKIKIGEIEEHCRNKGIYFKSITTPARFYREDKQTEWTNFLLDDNM